MCSRFPHSYVVMSQSTKLCVIIEEHDSRKLTLPVSIPYTVNLKVQDRFFIKGDFCLKCKDPLLRS